jgi:hypothetical protein
VRRISFCEEGTVEKKRQRLIQQLDQARDRLQTLLANIDTEREIYPGWTIKHVLAHIAGWDDATIASLRAHVKGDQPGTPAVRGIDYYNAQSVATREALSYEQVIREWELARDELKTIIQEMPEDKLAEPLLFPWGQTGTIAQIIAIFASHETEHAEEIEKIIAQ